MQEREREELKARQAEREAQRMAEERRRQSVRMVEMEVRKANIAERKADGDTIGISLSFWNRKIQILHLIAVVPLSEVLCK